MTAPTSLPTSVPSPSHGATGLTLAGLWHSAFRSMASPVRVQLGIESIDPRRRHEEIRALFAEVERQCTRFDHTSDLMQANAAGDSWQPVGDYCLAAIEAAAAAHLATSGVFDPRVLRTLTELGYGTTLPFGTDDVRIDRPMPGARPHRTPWRPGIDRAASAVRVGPEPIDLGGIGKGLTLRWAADQLRAAGCHTFLVDAGGDCIAGGPGPDGDGWRVGVEDPAGGADPMAVLVITDGACATSSTRLLAWQVGDSRVHHLIDPRTGRPGGAGLRSVTVIAADPADAEVWSKTLFLHGSAIAQVAETAGLAALWVDAEGAHACSSAMRPYVMWERS